MVDLVLKDLKALNRKGMVLEGKDANANYNPGKDYYLIAIRSTNRDYYNRKGQYDFHFMRRTADGCWRFKAGPGPIIQLNKGYTPTQITWDTYGYFYTDESHSKTTFKVQNTNFYTSAIIYMKVSYK